MKKFMRIKEVVKVVSVSKSTIWLWVKEKKFPEPIKLSPRCTVWRSEAVEAFMDSQTV